MKLFLMQHILPKQDTSQPASIEHPSSALKTTCVKAFAYYLNSLCNFD